MEKHCRKRSKEYCDTLKDYIKRIHRGEFHYTERRWMSKKVRVDNESTSKGQVI